AERGPQAPIHAVRDHAEREPALKCGGRGRGPVAAAVVYDEYVQPGTAPAQRRFEGQVTLEQRWKGPFLVVSWKHAPQSLHWGSGAEGAGGGSRHSRDHRSFGRRPRIPRRLARVSQSSRDRWVVARLALRTLAHSGAMDSRDM